MQNMFQISITDFEYATFHDKIQKLSCWMGTDICGSDIPACRSYRVFMNPANMLIPVTVFWFVTPSWEDGGGMVLWNTVILSHHYIVSQPRWPWLDSSLPWKRQLLRAKLHSNCR
jgi:hypothetical protein